MPCCWMSVPALQLVHHRLHLHIMGEVEEAASLEVAHADGAHLAVTVGSLHRPPRTEHVAVVGNPHFRH